ncbi:Protein kinase domain-containing protein [Fusarium falciforme]|uniref:Protein kinase domain-containing protein n=1 Tax=Fusarium falciforme TaxID=195108 RepID=UPI002301A30E|nr:Protein kinase domain-containing protein [Fusarium falciforme]WAO95561.1 Protein kinase domain-containing protein [Fusarium falciforme]
MSSKRPLLSDLVRDSKINTEFLESCIQHVFHEAGRSLKQRLVRREERWVRQRYLGQGAYGTVYLEKREDGGTGELRAVKELKKSVVPGHELDYARELEAIMKFSHPRYRHCFVSSRGWYEHQESVFITMEFLELGDLQRYLTRPLPESQGQEITKQTLEGLSFMHDNGFIHRDLKPANIMVVTKGPNWFVKIADFGISRRRHQDVTTLLTSKRGTLGFAVPEALGVESDVTYSFPVDMWSLGAVAYRILTNASAFSCLSNMFRYASGMLEFPEEKLKFHNVSELGRNFIIKLMQPVPEDRLSAAQAMLHPWFTTPLLPTVEDASDMSDSTTDEEERDITDASMPSKAWSSDEHATIRTPVSLTTKQYRQVSDPTMASKARSPDNTTVMSAHRTDCPISESNYEAPSVEDCADDNHESDPLPKLPGDSKWVLDLEDDLDDDNSSEGSATQSGQDSTEDSIPQTIPLNQARPIDTEESSETDCTDKESEYESDTDSGAEREDTATPPHPVDDAPKESVKTAVMVECQSCGLSYEWKGRNIQRLPCQHYMCHVCLLQYLALSLISPKYMSARCCDSPKGEIKGESFGNIVVDPRINTAWKKYELLKDHDDWRCPRGHPPKGGSLTITVGSRNSPPIWKEVVNCSGCLTQTRLIDGSVKELRPTSFCLLCLKELSGNVCNQCEQNSAVWPFITRMQERIDAPASWLSSVLRFACRDRLTIRNGSCQLQFQTLAQLKGISSPDEGQSESEAENTKSDVNNDPANTQKPESQMPSPGTGVVPPEQSDSSTARTSHSDVGGETGSRRSRSKRKQSSHGRHQSPKPTRARTLWEKITPQVFHSQPKKKKKR